jgi:hypothetical protein
MQNNKIASHLHRHLQLRYLDKDQSLEKCRIMATSCLLPSIARSGNDLSVVRLAIWREKKRIMSVTEKDRKQCHVWTASSKADVCVDCGVTYYITDLKKLMNESTMETEKAVCYAIMQGRSLCNTHRLKFLKNTENKLWPSIFLNVKSFFKMRLYFLFVSKSLTKHTARSNIFSSSSNEKCQRAQLFRHSRLRIISLKSHLKMRYIASMLMPIESLIRKCLGRKSNLIHFSTDLCEIDP